MKRYGKTAGYTLLALFFAALVVTWMWPREVKADTWSDGTVTMSIHKNMGDGFTTITNAYAIISPRVNCDMYDSTGAANATYASAAITFTADGQYTDEALGTLPSLPQTIGEWEITFYENSSPTAGDTAIVGPVLLNPETGMTYSDANNSRNGSSFVQVRVR